METSTKLPSSCHLDLVYEGSILTREISSLRERIISDLLEVHWQKIHKFLGECTSGNGTSQFVINIEDGSEIGSAEVIVKDDGVVSIVLFCPCEALGVEILSQGLLNAGLVYTDEVLSDLFMQPNRKLFFTREFMFY